MLKDKILVGAIIGISSNVVKLFVNYLGYRLGFSNVVFWQIAASRFLEKDDLNSGAAYIIGGVADLTVSAALGVAFIYILEFIGKDNLWLRGIGLGLAIWVFLFGSLLGQSAVSQEPSGILLTLVAHLVYGLALSLFTGLYLKKVNQDENAVNDTKKKSKSFTIIPQPARKGQVFHIKNMGIDQIFLPKKTAKPKWKRPKKI